MENRYRYVGNGVVFDSLCGRYLTAVDSSASIRKRFYRDEASYEVSSEDIEIHNQVNDTYTNAVLITFGCESDDGEELHLLGMIVSTHLGTFISDWN